MIRKLFLNALCTAMLIPGIRPEIEIPEEPAEQFEILSESDASSQSQVPETSGINVEYHTVDEIRAFSQNNPVQYLHASYETEPDAVNPPYKAGVLTQKTLDDGLRAVNLVRYIAGLNYNVSLSDSYTELVQAGALVNAVNKTISHYPAKPEGIDEDLYQKASEGNGSANLAMGYGTLASAVISAWLNDGDSYNIDRVGHRRWLLNSAMGKTGFGQVGKYTGMYAFDRTSSSSLTSNLWPAQNTPVEFFSSEYPWSVSTGVSEDISAVTVTMTNVSTGAKLVFSNDSADGYFNVQNSYYGVPGAIIWRPENNTWQPGDSVKIDITGLTNGNISYTVNFFQLNTEEETMTVVPDTMTLAAGETASATVQFNPATCGDSIAQWGWTGSNVVKITYEAPYFYITGVTPGVSTVTIYSTNGLTADIHVTVTDQQPVHVTGITLSQSEAELDIGESIQLEASVEPEDADDPSVVWSSSDPDVASVDSTGKVTALSGGNAVITASTNDGNFTAECTVTVKYEPLSAELILEDEIIEANQEIVLKAEASGGAKPYRYRFTVKTDGVWNEIPNSGNNAEVTYTFDEPGVYPVCVTVTDTNGQSFKRQKKITVKSSEPLNAELLIESDIQPGEETVFKAIASGGTAPYKYRFTVKTAEGWKEISAYSNTSEVSYTFDDIGIYYVCAAVKDAEGTIVKSQKKIGVASEELRVHLESSKLTAGQPGTLKAVGSGGVGPYTYKFTAKLNGKWKTIRGYESSDTCVWTPEAAGIIPVCVYIKDQTGTVYKYQKKLSVSAE